MIFDLAPSRGRTLRRVWTSITGDQVRQEACLSFVGCHLMLRPFGGVCFADDVEITFCAGHQTVSQFAGIHKSISSSQVLLTHVVYRIMNRTRF